MKQIVDDFNATVGREEKIFVNYLSMSSVDQKTLLATAAGVPPDVAGVWDNQVRQFAAMPPDLGTSILFDRQAGRTLEWDARNGVVQRLGRRHGIATPVSDVVVPLLAAASDA